MEMENKRSRAGNDDDEDDGEAKGEVNKGNARMRLWHHPSSRIYRVSRATGGKDRHSKVYTSKGLRDRRVRLSVSTAIQFYDLQDRLGYDQPSKAIEWLIKAASSAIAELPALDATFPEPLIMEKPAPSAETSNNNNQQQNSSASETSKGSVLSLLRSESRVKARERARERVRDKEDADHDHDHVVASLNSHGSFTKLLTEGSSINGQASETIQKQVHNLLPVTSTADYFGPQSSSLFAQQKTSQSISPVFSSQAHFGGAFSSAAGSQNPEPFAFLPDPFFPAASAVSANGGGDCSNLNFSMSPSFAGFQRGTLQSNSPSHHHHQHHQLSHHNQVQALSVPVPFFFGVPAAVPVSSTENPYSAGFDGHLQLCDGSYKQFELKGKGKS